MIKSNPLDLLPDLMRIVVVDDHAVVRQGTRDMLNQIQGGKVIGECAEGVELSQFLKIEIPDMILLDINLPGKNGLQLLEEIKLTFPQIKIVLFSAHLELQYIRKAQQLNADGYFSKTMTEAELQFAIQQIRHRSSAWVISKDVEDQLNRSISNNIQAHLTAREMEILSHLAQGLTNQTIAKTLSLSVKTVDTHVANLIKKTGVHNRTQLLAYAYEHQLLP